MMTTIDVHDRQTTALILFARLGNRFQWVPWLNRWASEAGSNEGLCGSNGLQLFPFLTDGRRVYYSVSDIEKFVEEAKKADSSLHPASTTKPITVELDCAWMDSHIPWKMRKIRRGTSTTTTGPSWDTEYEHY